MINTLLSLDPIAFQLGAIKVHWYGIIIATGGFQFGKAIVGELMKNIFTTIFYGRCQLL